MANESQAWSAEEAIGEQSKQQVRTNQIRFDSIGRGREAGRG